jgi:integrase
MAAILSGTRPGELARLHWRDVVPRQDKPIIVNGIERYPRERCFIIRGAKAGNDVRVPLSAAIAQALKAARAAAPPSSGDDFVFPGRTSGSHVTKFDGDGLIAHGMMLRRTWRTVAAVKNHGCVLVCT